jgi:hypothetical protein
MQRVQHVAGQLARLLDARRGRGEQRRERARFRDPILLRGIQARSSRAESGIRSQLCEIREVR